VNQEEEKFCLDCLSTNLENKTIEDFVSAPYGPAVPCRVNVSICRDCGQKNEATGANDDLRRAALEKSAALSIPKMVDLLSLHYSMAGIERALRLSPKSLSQWKEKKTTSSNGMSLLRIYATCPWLVEVAANNFDKAKVLEIVGRHLNDIISDSKKSTSTATVKQPGTYFPPEKMFYAFSR